MLLVAFELASRPGMFFVPNDVVSIGLDRLEVVAGEVEVIRRSVKSLITPEQMAGAAAHQQAILQDSTVKAGKRANERLSTALDAYIVPDRKPPSLLGEPTETSRRRFFESARFGPIGALFRHFCVF